MERKKRNQLKHNFKKKQQSKEFSFFFLLLTNQMIFIVKFYIKNRDFLVG